MKSNLFGIAIKKHTFMVSRDVFKTFAKVIDIESCEIVGIGKLRCSIIMFLIPRCSMTSRSALMFGPFLEGLDYPESSFQQQSL